LGGRSKKAYKILEENGYANLHNLTGGIIAYGEEIDPELTPY
jgi:rhodanese-related sulfurtransferase